MDLLSLIVVIAIVGFVVWAITTLIPMPAPFKQVIIGFACLVLCLYVLQALGVWHGFNLRLR